MWRCRQWGIKKNKIMIIPKYKYIICIIVLPLITCSLSAQSEQNIQNEKNRYFVIVDFLCNNQILLKKHYGLDFSPERLCISPKRCGFSLTKYNSFFIYNRDSLTKSDTVLLAAYQNELWQELLKLQTNIKSNLLSKNITDELNNYIIKKYEYGRDKNMILDENMWYVNFSVTFHNFITIHLRKNEFSNFIIIIFLFDNQDNILNINIVKAIP
jgi:hypothetical protein